MLPSAARAASGMRIGMNTEAFRDLTNAELARELAASDIKLVQLCFTQKDSKFSGWNRRTDTSGLTPARCREIAAIYRDAGVEIFSIAVYANLIHPDEAEREGNIANFEAVMEIGDHMNVHNFVTEAGHYYEEKTPTTHNAIEFQDETWTRMVGVGHRLAAMAEKHDAKVLLEPAHWGFFLSAKRLQTYLETVNSPRIRALLDPANLLEVNDLEEMFQHLSPWIDCLHAKDRKLHVLRGVAAGKGDLDYKQFIALATKHTPRAPLVLEYVNAKDYKDALAHLRKAMNEAGVAEA